MSKPNKKDPITTVNIYCKKCSYQLLKYRKGGKGALVKCFIQRIAADFTTDRGVCPKCGSHFARQTMIRGTPALKMIGGKVLVR